MAEGILRAAVNSGNLDIEIDSAGTSNYHLGEAPDSRARKLMNQKGIPINDLEARQFKVEDFDLFDKIFAMDEQNMRDIIALSRDEFDEAKVSLYLDYGQSQSKNVPDPYYGSESDYARVYQLLTEATAGFLGSIKST